MYSGEKVLVGLEHGKAADYAMRLNLAAQINLVNGALPRMRVGGRSAFVTILRTFMEPDHSPLAFHADMPIYIQCPRLGFQQRP
jgi:hypothetical protein